MIKRNYVIMIWIVWGIFPIPTLKGVDHFVWIHLMSLTTSEIHSPDKWVHICKWKFSFMGFLKMKIYMILLFIYI